MSLGFDDDELESSAGQMADTAAAYCPGRPSQLRQKSTTKFSDTFAAPLCRSLINYNLIDLNNFPTRHQDRLSTLPLSLHRRRPHVRDGEVRLPLRAVRHERRRRPRRDDDDDFQRGGPLPRPLR